MSEQQFVPVVPADGRIHPKVKAAGLVGAVVTGLAAVVYAASGGAIEVPDPDGVTNAVLVLIGAGSAVAAGYRKAAR